MTALPGLEDDTPRRWSKTETGYLAHMAQMAYDLDGYSFWGLAEPDPTLTKHRGQLGADEVDTVWLATADSDVLDCRYRLALVIIADGTVLAWREATHA